MSRKGNIYKEDFTEIYLYFKLGWGKGEVENISALVKTSEN